MLLSTFFLLATFFTALSFIGFTLQESFKIGVIVGSIGFMILGLTLLSDSRGLVIEDGKTIITDNKTLGQVETTETIQYEEISTGITQFLRISTLLTGLALLYTSYTLYLPGKEDREFERKTR